MERDQIRPPREELTHLDVEAAEAGAQVVQLGANAHMDLVPPLLPSLLVEPARGHEELRGLEPGVYVGHADGEAELARRLLL